MNKIQQDPTGSLAGGCSLERQSTRVEARKKPGGQREEEVEGGRDYLSSVGAGASGNDGRAAAAAVSR